MKVTTEYMEKTTHAMVEAGFECVRREDIEKRRDEELIYEGTRWLLTRGPHVELELEALRYPEGNERFYLRIGDYHGIESFSFELDSWKLWPERVEFKYYAHPQSGTGLTINLWFAGRPPHREAPE